MSLLLPLGFTTPWILLGLGLLPVIWWLLRQTPPRPREIAFPPLRLLLALKRPEETPERSPWWLTLLRLVLAALVILALAGPVWRPDAAPTNGRGPLLVVLDNGWAAAPDWEARRAAAARALDAAAAADRPVILAVSAPVESEQDLAPKSAAEAARRLGGIEPQPYQADRQALAAALDKAARESHVTESLWFADGLENGGSRAFAEALARLSPSGLSIYTQGARLAVGLKSARNAADALEAVVAGTGAPAQGLVRAIDGRSRTVAEAPYRLDAGAREAQVRFVLPVELRNEVARVELAGESSAGAVQLVDESARRRRVGLISGESADQAEPLLSPLYYIGRALSPYAELREAPRGDVARAVKDLIDAKSSVIVLADVGTLVGDAGHMLDAWVENGGTLVRFAGPRLAAGSDDLTPVQLRRGGRVLGGTLSWEQPQPLAAFPAGPFAGLPVPPDVVVNRQVLAEPDADLSDKTWAALADGTPLVTAAARGKGRIVLFHVTADTRWSNLPISGAFVEMLRRIVALAPAAGGTATASGAPTAGGAAGSGATEAKAAENRVPLPPLRVLDGHGRLGAPSAMARPIQAAEIDAARPGREHPPGFYGTEDGYRALNLLRASDVLAPLDVAGLPNTRLRSYVAQGAVELRPWLLGLAAALLILDSLAVLVLAGTLRLRGAVAALALLLLLPPPPQSQAGAPEHVTVAQAAPSRSPNKDAGSPSAAGVADDFALKASLETHLAYVITGDSDIDNASRAGLLGLSRFLAERTAFEPAEPMGVDIAHDELAFFPLLYWPIDANAPTPSPETLERIDAFMKNGGTILFDTRDQLLSPPGGQPGPNMLALRRILSSLDLPPLEPAPSDHVVTKAFYLLQDFPGRYQGSPLWVEALPESTAHEDRPARAGDGVSPLLITANDLAGAWAVDESGAPLFPTVPADPRQRELAYRAGVNIVMYALTGNYKADQVHVPALLERLGQ